MDFKLKMLGKLTREDEELKLITKYIREGWPKDISEKIKPYFKFRQEITEGNGLIYKYDKVIIPTKMRVEILNKIHSGHFGIRKCILRASQVIFWPGMATDITNLVSKCRSCQKFKKSNPPEPLVNYEIPEIPWFKVGIDIYEVYRIQYLLVVDYYSKFVEIEKRNRHSTLENMISKLKQIFSRQGIPAHLVSDEGPQLTSKSFKKFVENWNINHLVVSPYFQQANGLAERSIRTVKK